MRTPPSWSEVLRQHPDLERKTAGAKPAASLVKQRKLHVSTNQDDLNKRAQEITAALAAPPAGSEIPAELKAIVEQFQGMRAALLLYADQVNQTLTTEI